MFRRYFDLGRLQRKVLIVVSVIVVVPMLVAGWLASAWVSTSFERRLEQWIVDAARGNQNWLQAYQNDAVMLGRVSPTIRRTSPPCAPAPRNPSRRRCGASRRNSASI